MDPSVFTTDSWGTVTRTAGGNPAFVPYPAPRDVPLARETIALLDQASGAVGELRGIGRRLPNPDLLIGPYLRQEAVLSSRIEGTQTTLGEVFASEAEQLELISSPDIREVMNYLSAFHHGLERLDTLPLSLRLIRELHEILLHDVRGAARQPGQFRTYQNFIGGATEASATYVPPPVPQMTELLTDFELFLHDRAPRPLVQMAILHYQFEAIHPFGDGNGRVGRLLTSVFLRERGLVPHALLFLSPYFERTRSAYYAGLMRVSTHGDWNGWIQYVLEGVRLQAEASAVLADRLASLQSRYREEIQARRGGATVLALVDGLFVNPVVTARRLQDALGVTAPTARSAIELAESLGILREITSRKRGRIYRAEEIFQLFDTNTE